MQKSASVRSFKFLSGYQNFLIMFLKNMSRGGGRREGANKITLKILLQKFLHLFLSGYQNFFIMFLKNMSGGEGKGAYKISLKILL